MKQDKMDFGKLLQEIMSSAAMMENKQPIGALLVKTRIEAKGGIFVKLDSFDMFFKIPKGGKADDQEFLRAQRDELKKQLITLKVKKI